MMDNEREILAGTCVLVLAFLLLSVIGRCL